MQRQGLHVQDVRELPGGDQRGRRDLRTVGSLGPLLPAGAAPRETDRVGSTPREVDGFPLNSLYDRRVTLQWHYFIYSAGSVPFRLGLRRDRAGGEEDAAGRVGAVQGAQHTEAGHVDAGHYAFGYRERERGREVLH